MRSAIAMASLFLLVIASPFVSAADGDGDGIDDTLDMCPFAAGTANSTAGNGCPDSNGNGIADFEEPGDDVVLRKVLSDFEKGGVGIDSSKIRHEMDRLMPLAKQEIMDE